MSEHEVLLFGSGVLKKSNVTERMNEKWEAAVMCPRSIHGRDMASATNLSAASNPGDKSAVYQRFYVHTCPFFIMFTCVLLCIHFWLNV